MRRALWLFVYVLAPFAFLFSCDSGAYDLAVTPEELVITNTQDHPVLSAALVDRGGDEIPVADVEWQSSNPQVVSVNEDGRISARTNGEATITAKTAAAEKEVRVSVRLSMR